MNSDFLSGDEYMSQEEVSRALNKAVGTLTNDRHLGRGPRYVKVGRRVLYRRQDIADYLATCVVDPAARRNGGAS